LRLRFEVAVHRGAAFAAADELEALRADLDKSAKFAYSAVHAERAAIVELVESFERVWLKDVAKSWHVAARRIADASKGECRMIVWVLVVWCHAERPCIHHFDPSTRTEVNDVVLSEVYRTEAACERGAMNLKGVVKGATDIVERLRVPGHGMPVMLEAADEIERLRAHAFTLGELDDKIASAVAAERAAILELVESFVRSWDQDDVTSWHEAAKRIAAAIKAPRKE
jgi:hypothetical protein